LDIRTKEHWTEEQQSVGHKDYGTFGQGNSITAGCWTKGRMNFGRGNSRFFNLKTVTVGRREQNNGQYFSRVSLYVRVSQNIGQEDTQCVCSPETIPISPSPDNLNED
jgi:hypothetical protein